MQTRVAEFIVTCEGPPLDYTARVNLQSEDVVILDDGEGAGDPRFRDAARAVRVQLEASSSDDAISRVKGVLATRPYVDFEVVGGVSSV